MPPRTPDEARAAAERFRADYEAVRAQIGRSVVGHGEVVAGVLTCLFAGGHTLLEGVPGIGKTLLVRTLARALSLSFGRVQFTPDLMPSDITGTVVITELDAGGPAGVASGGRREFRFQPGPIFAQLVLADEINRATPKTQSAMLEAMQERAVTVAGETHPLPAPFLVMATQNPLEQEGTYPLPEAQLDRFMLKLLVRSSSREELHEILERTTGAASVGADAVLTAEAILAHQALVREVPIAPHVRDYAVRLVLATHPKGPYGDGRYATPMVNQYVRVGASPRAAQALTLGAKVRALVEGRFAASVDDVRELALPALRHRMILNFEGESEGVTTDAIIGNLVDTLPVEAASS
ncbi:MAG: AAA family ATPase [Phycisphaerales bacterium]|nr:AAA family ATPase [Phycisphaerales bacterium]